MNNSLKRLVLATTLSAAAFAHASSITSAIIYENTPYGNDAANPNNTAASLAHANFTIGAGGINYRSEVTGFTAATFLNNPTFTNAVNGFSPTASIDNIELVITGYITLNKGANSFILGHDDGAILNIAGFGNVVNAPGGTSYNLSPFTVTTTSGGEYAFTLNYAECCGAPADLTFAINNSVVSSATPEPSSIVLLGSGLLTAAAFTRRRLFNKA